MFEVLPRSSFRLLGGSCFLSRVDVVAIASRKCEAKAPTHPRRRIRRPHRDDSKAAGADISTVQRWQVMRTCRRRSGTIGGEMEAAGGGAAACTFRGVTGQGGMVGSVALLLTVTHLRYIFG
jgi:hypothetical protein